MKNSPRPFSALDECASQLSYFRHIFMFLDFLHTYNNILCISLKKCA